MGVAQWRRIRRAVARGTGLTEAGNCPGGTNDLLECTGAWRDSHGTGAATGKPGRTWRGAPRPVCVAWGHPCALRYLVVRGRCGGLAQPSSSTWPTT